MYSYIHRIPIPAAFLTNDGFIIDCNQYFPPLLALEKDEMQGLDLNSFVHPGDIRLIQNLKEQLLNEGTLIKIEVRVVLRDKRIINLGIFANTVPSSPEHQEGIIVYARDFSEQKQQEQSWLTSNRRYEKLLNQMNEGLVVSDTEGQVLFANERFLDMTGYAHDELMAKDVSFLFDTRGLREWKAQLNNLREGIRSPYTLTLKHKNGTKIPVLINPDIIRDKVGNVTEIYALVRDLSEENDLRLKLDSRMKIQDAFLNSSPVSFFVRNAEGVLVAASHNYRQFIEYTPKKMTGKRLPELFGDITAGTIREEDDSVLSTGKPHETERQNSGRTYRTHKFLINVSTGENLVGGYIVDVTERKAVESALQTSEERYRSLAENAQDFIFVENTDGIIEYANSYYTKYLGVEPKDMIGKSIHEIIPADAGLMEDLLKYVRDSGNVLTQEQGISFGDRTIWLDTRLVPLKDENGIVRSVLGISRDITEKVNIRQALIRSENSLAKLTKNLEKRVQEELAKQKEQQNMLIQKSKLESLGEMAAGIAHEINQPLGLLTLTLDNMEESLRRGKMTDDYLQNKMKALFGQIDKIKTIIEHVRLFSRDQRFQLNENVSLNLIIQDTLSLLRTQYRNQQIDIQLVLDDRLGLVRINRIKLEQVLQNLMSNSRYALNEKARSVEGDVSMKIIRISTHCDEEKVYLEVWDNGTGIPKKYLSKLFDPFFTTKGGEHGTGIGLPICYGIIKEFCGDIRFETKAGKFTKVIVTLPRIYERANAEQLTREARSI